MTTHWLIPTARAWGTITVVGALVAAAVAPRVAFAQAADKAAECFRLSEELQRLATRNAWAGVETKYDEMMALKCEASYAIHKEAARSAATLGKTYEQFQRLERARAVDPNEEVQAEVDAIEANYGRVDLQGNERWTVTLRRPAMPFAPDQRKSVEWAVTVCAEAGGFKGMIPAGTYYIGAEDGKEVHEFTVTAGQDWNVIVIEKAWVSGSEGLIVYHGPFGVAGYTIQGSPAPAEPVEDGNGVDTAQPDTLSGSGINVDVGYQIGFTREFGVVASVEYRGMYSGQDTLHGVTGWVGGAVTPGRARVALGPVYSYIAASGQGVAPWFDIGQDPIADPTNQIRYSGWTFAGGAKLTAGYGLLDLDRFQGVVQVGGVWQTDTARSYWAGHVRFGIEPQVPRFRD